MKPIAFQLLKSGELSWWYTARSSVVHRVLKHFLTQTPQRILDIGAGFGGMFPVLKHFGSVTALESHADRAAECTELAYETVSRSLNDLPPEPFSLFGAFDVLEHIEDEITFLRTLRRHSPQAALIATVPAYRWLWSSHDVENAHFRRYEIQELVRVIETAGFRVRYVSHWNTVLFLPAALWRSLGLVGGQAFRLPKLLDAVVRSIVLVEARLLPRWRLPFGLSIVIYAEPPAT